MTITGTIKPGNIPTASIAPTLAMLIRDRWPHGGGNVVLAEKVGCDGSAIESIIAQECPGASFDLVDALFCALGRPMEDCGLGDVYWSARFVETCASPVCGKTFPEKALGPSRRKKFCSKRCKDLEEKIRKGAATGVRRRNLCNRGHRLTPDNIWLKPNGGRQCKTCAYARRDERMEDPEYRAQILAYHKCRHRERKTTA